MSARASGSLTGARGLELFTQSWLPDDGSSARAVVVLVHGFGEHCDRYDSVARDLTGDGIAVHACDHQGHGRSQGPRALVRIDEVLSDLDQLVAEAAAAHPGRPVFMLGHSLGGLLATHYALHHQDRLRGLVLSGALAAVDGPRAAFGAVRAFGTALPHAPTIKLDPALVSRDRDVVAAYRADPLVHHGRMPAGTLAEIVGGVSALPDAVGRIQIPALILYGTADGLCSPRGSVMLSQRIGSADVGVRAYEGLYHEILNEPERDTVLGDVTAWLRAHA